jgi:hypothetical protein
MLTSTHCSFLGAVWRREIGVTYRAFDLLSYMSPRRLIVVTTGRERECKICGWVIFRAIEGAMFWRQITVSLYGNHGSSARLDYGFHSNRCMPIVSLVCFVARVIQAYYVDPRAEPRNCQSGDSDYV